MGKVHIGNLQSYALTCVIIRRIDEIPIGEGWDQLKDVAAQGRKIIIHYSFTNYHGFIRHFLRIFSD